MAYLGVSCTLLSALALVQGDLKNSPDYTSQMRKARNVSKVINYVLNDSGYDIKIRPNDGGEPVEVTTEVKIVSFGEFMEAKMEFTMDIYFRQWWYDPRFRHNVDRVFTMAGDASKLFWTPDTYFVNAKLSVYHYVTRENMRIMIWPDGKIYFSTRITLTVQCSMDFHLYPMDTQHCPLIIESYAHTMEDIKYKWRTGTGIEVVSQEIAQFEMKDVKKDTGAQSNSAGSFSSIKAWFSFKRRTTYFFNQNFLPTIFLVMISWCQFWISPEAVPARLSLSVTTVLSILFLSSTINGSMPKVSYMKAIDYFLSVSFVFIFSSLTEYVMVLNMCPVSKKKEVNILEKLKEKDKDSTNVVITIMDRNTCGGDRPMSNKHFITENKNSGSKFQAIGSSHRVDKWSRIAFPLSYSLFLLSYWLYYSHVYGAL